MKHYKFTKLDNKEYIGIITVLDSDLSLDKILDSFTNKPNSKILIDLAIKFGIDKNRFIEYNVDNNGKIIFNSKKNIEPEKEIILFANSIVTNNIYDRNFLSFL